MNIVKKLILDNWKSWHKKIHKALSKHRVTPKSVIGISSFELVYGMEASHALPLELATRKLRIVIENDIYKHGVEKRILYLRKLEEEREEIIDHITEHQIHVMSLFDKRAILRKFVIGDSVLLWDKQRKPQDMHKKFDTLWKGTFTIHHAFENNSLKIIAPNI